MAYRIWNGQRNLQSGPYTGTDVSLAYISVRLFEFFWPFFKNQYCFTDFLCSLQYWKKTLDTSVFFAGSAIILTISEPRSPGHYFFFSYFKWSYSRKWKHHFPLCIFHLCFCYKTYHDLASGVYFLYSIFIHKSNFRQLLLGISVLIIFFIKNIWTFGYPVFPVAIADPDVFWKPNPEVLKISSQYAVMKTYDMQYTYKEIQRFSTADYIKNWLTLPGIKSKINILFVAGLALFSVFTWIKKENLSLSSAFRFW